jgi:hypothetical protein
MTATTLSRAASAASVHFHSINASRKKCGLPALTAAEVEHSFADVDRSPVRTKAVTTRATSNTGAADALWGGIITKLNASLSSSRAPIAAGCTSPATSAADGRVDAVVDWSAIARNLNAEAGLKAPARGGTR